MARERRRNFHFEIITRTGGHVGTSAMGYDPENAKYQLRLQYPGCTIIRMWE